MPGSIPGASTGNPNESWDFRPLCKWAGQGPPELYGLRRVGREDRVTLFEASLADAEVLPFDDAAARLAGRINADLERAGRVIGLPDVMIAAIALRNPCQSSPATSLISNTSARHATTWPSRIGEPRRRIGAEVRLRY